MDMTLFGRKDLADDRVKLRSLEWALINDCVLMKGGGVEYTHTHTEGERYVHMKLLLGDASVISGRPKNCQKTSRS